MSRAQSRNNASHALRVRSADRLWSAWRHVRSKGVRSRSDEIKSEILSFDENAHAKIRSVARRLQRRTFEFGLSAGRPAKRPGKHPRPIVIASAESRLVQRAILEVIQKDDDLRPLYESVSSFGMRGVPEAMRHIRFAMELSSPRYYIRSDIVDFFSRLPRRPPIQAISSAVGDPEFAQLLENATRVELVNAEALGPLRSLYPDEVYGVAQGGALSALLGDVRLREFDQAMNSADTHCLRYVDDFVILARSPRTAKGAFRKAQRILRDFNMDAYDPETSPNKANHGWLTTPWQFLGCELCPGIIRPSKAAKRDLIETVETRFRESLARMADPRRARARKHSFAKAVDSVQQVVKGWGDQYSFCNDRQGFDQLDVTIGNLFERYQSQFGERSVRLSAPDRRRALGLAPLRDCDSDPIFGSSTSVRSQASGT